jgi:hypothetical protein
MQRKEDCTGSSSPSISPEPTITTSHSSTRHLRTDCFVSMSVTWCPPPPGAPSWTKTLPLPPSQPATSTLPTSVIDPTTTPSLTRTIPNPGPSDTYDRICHCATGNKTVPAQGRWLCGWCGAIQGLPGHGIQPYDTMLCKDNQCRNYGSLDAQCEKAGNEQPPNFKLW